MNILKITKEDFNEFQNNLAIDIETILESHGVYTSDLDYEICKYIEDSLEGIAVDIVITTKN